MPAVAALLHLGRAYRPPDAPHGPLYDLAVRWRLMVRQTVRVFDARDFTLQAARAQSSRRALRDVCGHHLGLRRHRLKPMRLAPDPEGPEGADIDPARPRRLRFY